MLSKNKSSNIVKMPSMGGAGEMRAKLEALDKSQARIEFDLEGNILDANENFCNAMGYARDEIVGKHHSIFADPEYAKSSEYKEFWKKLAAGEFQAAQYKRFGKGGNEIWIEASYNPLFKNGKPYRVVKFVTDITDKQMEYSDLKGQVEAIDRSQAVIHFTPDGTILDANENFLSVMGYSKEEIVGKHHSMFAEPGVSETQEYKDFWKKLREGHFEAGQYKRLGKGGKEVWIEASYNPIHDPDGNVVKVIKFATDLTPRKEENKKMAADFESNVKSVVQIVATSATELQSTAQALSAAAEETSSQSNVVASATEELSASVSEISSQVANSTGIISEAVSEAQRSEELVSGLVEAASKIGEVTAIISEIADQTNLLALNATIEAARAGDAGKGFAVVASEVKSLAAETAKATEEIERQITGIQDVSKTTAEAIKSIVNVINQVNEISTSISGAVEEQSAATREVSSNIVGVQKAAAETGESSTNVLDVSRDLSKRSEDLEARVDEFLQKVRDM